MRSSPRSLARRARTLRVVVSTLVTVTVTVASRSRRVAFASRRRPFVVVVVVVVVVVGRRALTPNGSHRPPRRARILFFCFFFAEIHRRPGAPRRRGRGGGSVGRWWTRVDVLNPKFGNGPRVRSRDRGAGEARERDGIVRAAAGETGMRVRCVMDRSVARARWIGGGKGRVERTRGSGWRGMRGEGISTRAFGGDARAWGGCSNARERLS